jgi:serine/threonine protein kinase
MSAPPPDPSPDLDPTRPAPPGSSSPRGFGAYRLLQQIGEGGMGEVWLAEQTTPVRRQVALKVIKAGMDTAQVVARFEAERQALALMDHPAIATVFDGGSTPEGRPYFVMEYVKGEPITTYCDRQRLTTQARLELFAQMQRVLRRDHPDTAKCLVGLAGIEAHRGRRDAALGLLEEAVRVDPRWAVSLASQKELKSLAGDPAFETLVASGTRK